MQVVRGLLVVVQQGLQEVGIAVEWERIVAERAVPETAYEELGTLPCRPVLLRTLELH